MTQIETLYLEYYKDITNEMLNDKAPFNILTAKLLIEFSKLGLTNIEKSNALVQVYTEEIKYLNSEASKAALALLDQDRKDILNDAQIETEKRKRQGYDDNVLIEIMKAQGGLASFAVNANSDTAQSTINDLHKIMGEVEDRVCDLACDVPAFNTKVNAVVGTAVNIDIFGSAGMVFEITKHPESGTLVVDANGTATYTPSATGLYSAIITTEDTNGYKVATRLAITVSTARGV